MKKNLTAAKEVIQEAFARARKQNPKFSLRSLAKSMKVSPAFLSKVFSGKTALPEERVDDFIRVLKIDLVGEKVLREAFLSDRTKALLTGRKVKLEKYQEMPERFHALLAKWYFIAVLDLSLVNEFQCTADWIAKRLSIKKSEAEQAIQFLKTSGFLVEREGRWQKAEAFIRFPTKDMKESFKNYYLQIFERAEFHLQTAREPEDYANRLISGITIAGSKKNIERAKSLIQETLFEVEDMLSGDDPEEVFFVGNLFFPLSKK